MCCIKIALRRSFFEKTVQSIVNGTDKGGSFVTVVRLETKLRATLTEQQKAMFGQIKKTDAEITTGMSYKRSKIYSTNGLRGIQAKRSVPSYKDKRKMKRDPSEHIRFEHTQEPIIDMQTWETVQKLRQGKRRPTSIGETSKYSGLLFCADCGSKLYFNHKRADDAKSCSFNCSHYRNNAKDKCTPHRIREVVLDELLLEELRRIAYTARTIERQIAEFINKKSSSENRRELNAKQRDYERLSKRTAELNALFKRLYEDNDLGRINNEQFRMLSCGYTDEQKSIDAKLPELEKQIQNLQQAASDVDKFIGLAKKYTRITDLTPEILHIFVSKIIIHERRERFKQNTEQQIDIYFRYIGNVAEM